MIRGFGLALSLLGACTAHPEGTRAPSSVPSPSPADDAPLDSETPSSDAEPVSVHPGINDRYFSDDAVATWTRALEKETREVAAKRELIIDALELERGMAVGDIGAGTGLFLTGLSQAVGPEGKLYAVEIVPDFATHLRERASKEGLTNVEVIEASPTDARLPDASVDLLFVCDVYHHVEYPSVYLPTLYAALRPGGRLVIVDFERIPGKTVPFLLKHVRADKQTVIDEVEAAGFVYEREIGAAQGLEFEENYMILFSRGAAK